MTRKQYEIDRKIETLENTIERFADLFRGNEDELARLRHGAGPSSYDRIAELMEENEGVSRRIEEMKLEIEELSKEWEKEAQA
jgi:chromosome segregation ATPase